MKIHPISGLKICLLGAVDGLLVGFVLEGSRFFYEKYRMRALLRQATDKPIGYLLDPTIDFLIPVVCLVAFTGMTHLFYRYLIDRPRSVLVLWVTIGVIAFSGGYFMAGGITGPQSILGLVLFAGMSYITFQLWRNHSEFLPFVWQVTGVSTVLLLAASAQIIGLFVVQRAELRQPLTWFVALVLVLSVNFLYGTLLRFGLAQNWENAMHVYD